MKLHKTTDRIEKEIVLRAPRARVWRALANAEEFGAWFGIRLDGAFAPGARVCRAWRRNAACASGPTELRGPSLDYPPDRRICRHAPGHYQAPGRAGHCWARFRSTSRARANLGARAGTDGCRANLSRACLEAMGRSPRPSEEIR